MDSLCAKRPLWLVLLVVSVVLSAGCGDSDDIGANARPLERPDLQQILRKLTREQHSGAVALVETEDGVWRGASAYAEGKRRADREDRFNIGSTTKTIVATIVLQLVGERQLALDDSIERWLPGRVRDGRRITIRQLLNHTSGLAQGFSPVLAPRNEQQPLLSPPGTTHSYSNLNYIILGLVIEKLTGRHLDQVVSDRIFRPLGLEGSSYGTIGPTRMRPWLGTEQESNGSVNGAGNIISTAADLATFFRALLGGELLEEELLAEMTQTVETGMEFRAGLGLFETKISCGTWWGHAGDSLSYSNQVLASRDGSTIVVVAQNGTGWQYAQATAEEMYCSVL